MNEARIWQTRNSYHLYISCYIDTKFMWCISMTFGGLWPWSFQTESNVDVLHHAKPGHASSQHVNIKVILERARASFNGIVVIIVRTNSAMSRIVDPISVYGAQTNSTISSRCLNLKSLFWSGITCTTWMSWWCLVPCGALVRSSWYLSVQYSSDWFQMLVVLMC